MSTNTEHFEMNADKTSLRNPVLPSNLAGNAAQQPQMRFDESHVFAAYANFARVTGTPEEVIIDLGLNMQPFDASAASVKISQRVVLSFYTAKRLLVALHTTLERFEQAFGVLETDVQKRANPGLGRIR
jgi:hypothetical protein